MEGLPAHSCKLGNGIPVVSFLVLGLLLHRIPGWRRFGSWLLLGLFFATNDPVAAGAGLGINGLVQRILVIEVLAWVVIMGWRTFRRS